MPVGTERYGTGNQSMMSEAARLNARLVYCRVTRVLALQRVTRH